MSAPSAETFVATRTRNVALRAAHPEFEAALHQAVDTIMDGAPRRLDVLAAHYRHFRSRFHTGREPQYTVTLPLLASKLVDADQIRLSPEARAALAEVFCADVAKLRSTWPQFPGWGEEL
jgi:hypothetical protein